MAPKRKALSRGLDALLGSAPPQPEPAPSPDSLTSIAVDLLQRGKYQPRLDMRPESLEDLASSIRSQGVVQPIVVRPVDSGAGGEQRYEIIAGERRWRAAQLAGLDAIPAVIRNVPDESAVAISLIENIQRENLNPLEEARALQRLTDEFELTHQQVAEAVGRSRTAVTNLLRLLELGEGVKEMVENRELEMGHARALLALPAVKQLEAARLVARKGLSVRETEELVRRALESPKKKSKPPRTKDPDVRRLEAELSEKLGAQVTVQHGNKGKGAVTIRYNSLDELDGILTHIR